MTVKSPMVTVIMPAYNAEIYIADSIQSVINQSLADWELIIINDGSTDKTFDIVNGFDDKRINLLEQKNGGVSSARNSGLELAKGKYITFLDADDLLSIDSLATRVNYLVSHKNIDIVDGEIDVMDSKMEKIIRTYKPYYSGRLLPRLVALDSSVFF